MSRTAQVLRSKVTAVIALVAIAGAIGGGIWYHQATRHLQTVTNAQHQVTQVNYHGATGADALTLLKKYAQVQTKHYSFGDMVSSINGVTGNGPKYWTFYVNGKEASVGAGAYSTKSTDVLAWKLQ
jgi:hypothetical protein